MKCIVMTFVQIETMVARQDGYEDVNEWRRDTPEEMRHSIYDLVNVDNMGFCRDSSAQWYTFQDDRGRDCVWYRY